MSLIKFIDKFLNTITMYRLILYCLSILTVYAVALAFFDVLPFSPLWLLLSVVGLIAGCFFSNLAFAYVFKAPVNIESSYITAFILLFVMTPANNLMSLLSLVGVGVIAMATKYFLAVRKKHIFNPAAAGAVIGASVGLGASSWWVSLLPMLPVVLVLGFLIIRKLRRFHMFFAFVATSLVSMVLFGLFKGSLSENWFIDIPVQAFMVWPLVFFGAFMFTEPFTTPPTKRLRLAYGVIVGLLFGAPLSVGAFNLTSETALVVGNVFSFLVGSKKRMKLKLLEKKEVARNIFEFVFARDGSFTFVPGQYLEWTLSHKHPDSRGNRRYFTIASSPTEDNLILASKIIDKSSSFKKALLGMEIDGALAAGQLSGEFTLPADDKEKIVMIAGGIGITPYRSMIKYLLDKGEKRDIVLFYACGDPAEFAFKEVFDQARNVGVKTVYIVTDKSKAPAGFDGRTGFLTKEVIESEAEDWPERTYYISGPEAMVSSYSGLLKSIGINDKRIVTDYFPGY